MVSELLVYLKHVNVMNMAVMYDMKKSREKVVFPSKRFVCDAIHVYVCRACVLIVGLV